MTTRKKPLLHRHSSTNSSHLSMDDKNLCLSIINERQHYEELKTYLTSYFDTTFDWYHTCGKVKDMLLHLYKKIPDNSGGTVWTIYQHVMADKLREVRMRYKEEGSPKTKEELCDMAQEYKEEKQMSSTRAGMGEQMNHQLFETKHLVNGKNIKDCTDEELFQAIAQIEEKIKELKKIKHKPKSLQTKLATMELDITSIVMLMDSSEECVCVDRIIN